MSSTVHYKINDKIKLSVKEGQEITPQTIIGQKEEFREEKIVPLAAILGVSPSTVTKYLKTGIGEEVEKGQVIAVKKSMFSQTAFKSPYGGKIKEINLRNGEIIFGTINMGKVFDIILPINGKVKSIRSDELEITVSGIVLKGLKGKGPDVWGKIVYFPKENLEILDRFNNIENSIVCCNKLNEETSLKLEVIGTKGLVVKLPPPKTNLPFILVEDSEFRKIINLLGSKIVLLPEALELVIYD